MNSAPSARLPFSAGRTILFGGLTIGTVDILWAIINTAIGGKGPVTVLQSVAGGLLGQATFDGGLPTALLGMVIHYSIATTVMTVYYFASRKFPVLARRPWLCGIVYGIGVYLFMYQIVLPLSAYHTTGIHWGLPLAKGLFIHMFGIGLLAGLFARRGSAQPA
jgi:hypothetical protein